MTIDNLASKYKVIENYNNDTSSIKINALERINYAKAYIFTNYRNVKEQIGASDIHFLIDMINKYTNKIGDLAEIIPNYKNTILFSTEANGQIDELNATLVQIHDWPAFVM